MLADLAQFEVEATILPIPLPGWEHAWIPEEKLKDYALNLESEKGHDKAYLFETELAIDRENWRYLSDRLLEGLPEAGAIFKEESCWGPKWTVPILVEGLNRRVRCVTTGWIIDLQDSRPRLTSAYIQTDRHNKELRLLDGRSDALRMAQDAGRMTMRAHRLTSPGSRRTALRDASPAVGFSQESGALMYR